MQKTTLSLLLLALGNSYSLLAMHPSTSSEEFSFEEIDSSLTSSDDENGENENENIPPRPESTVEILHRMILDIHQGNGRHRLYDLTMIPLGASIITAKAHSGINALDLARILRNRILYELLLCMANRT